MIAVVVVLLLAHSVSSIPIRDFFPFNGPSVCLFDTVTMLVHKNNAIGSDGVPIENIARGDCEEFRLTPNDDGSSPNISIGFTFPFFARRFRNLYVNTNGVVSFIEPVPQFSPNPFPIKDEYLISPYWADVDIRGIGDVFFKETTNSSLLAEANDIIQTDTVQARRLSRFYPRWMLIVTWNNVGYFSTHTDMTNTFQALLVTDGRHSFVVFNYLDDGISWTRGDASQVDAQVGFNFGGDILRSYVFPTSRTAAIADIEEDSSTGSPGQYVYRVDSAVIRNKTTTGSKCDEFPLIVDPNTASIINGGVIKLSGPSFNKSTDHDNVMCLFTDEDGDVTEYTDRNGVTHHTPIRGIIMNCEAICPMPLFRKLGVHKVHVTVNDSNFIGEFYVVPAVHKAPEVHISDPAGEKEFAVIDNLVDYTAIWDSEQLKKDKFKENGTIFFTLENWFYFLGKRWRQRGAAQNLFVVDKNADYDKGNVSFRQSANAPKRFQFDISVIVLVKQTKNLKILYTSSILSFAPRLFNVEYTRDAAILQYCNLWFAESIETIDQNDLQTCPCTKDAVTYDPNFISDPTCSATSRKCHENIEADLCYLKNVDNMNLGQQCCYDVKGNYITTNKPAGSADYYFPREFYLQHQSSDYFPYKTCCIDANDHEFCDKYYGKRPKDIQNGTSCTPAVPDRGNGGGRGDPHFITLDGVQYTFNGLGEYTLLDAHSGDFVIHIQTKQAVEAGGGLIPATSISVIAMKMRNKPVVQAQLDDIFGIKVLVESNMTETGYEELDFDFVPIRNYDGGHVEVEEEFSRNFMFENGVVIVIKASNDILSFQLSVPQTFRDNTKGLLGVWNGNQDDDFLRPDGTTFSVTSTEEEIFDNFGERWGVDESNSLIIIEEGFTRPVKDEDFKPLFISPMVDNTTQIMIDATCGNNSECAFDIAVTGNVDVGRTTLIEIEEQMTIINQSLPIVCDPPCQNDAPCVANDTCNCNTGFTGSVCESVIIQCDTPCENGGTCTRLERCSCPTGYFGQYCTIYNPCVGSPCEQECIIGRDGYTCQCSDGYFLAADNISCVKCAEAKARGGVDPTWHVALCDANTDEMMCSGTAINDQWILTSAGCVCNGLDRQSLSIRFGKNRTCFHRERREVRLSASEIYCYPNYKTAKLSLDFALIKLQSAIPVRNVKRSPPLCLSRQVRSTVLPGQKVLIYGWGRVGKEVPENAVLQSSGMVTIANLSECMTEFNADGIKGTPERMICTMANTTSGCNGNYGSAVITNTKNKLFLTAVVSKSTKSCGTDQSFLIHSKTRNLNFINWLNNITAF